MSTDRLTVRMVVAALSLIALAGLCGVMYLVGAGAPADKIAVVVALTGPAIGGLGTVLASTHSLPEPPPNESVPG